MEDSPLILKKGVIAPWRPLRELITVGYQEAVVVFTDGSPTVLTTGARPTSREARRLQRRPFVRVSTADQSVELPEKAIDSSNRPNAFVASGIVRWRIRPATEQRRHGAIGIAERGTSDLSMEIRRSCFAEVRAKASSFKTHEIDQAQAEISKYLKSFEVDPDVEILGAVIEFDASPDVKADRLQVAKVEAEGALMELRDEKFGGILGTGNWLKAQIASAQSAKDVSKLVDDLRQRAADQADQAEKLFWKVANSDLFTREQQHGALDNLLRLRNDASPNFVPISAADTDIRDVTAEASSVNVSSSSEGDPADPLDSIVLEPEPPRSMERSSPSSVDPEPEDVPFEEKPVDDPA